MSLISFDDFYYKWNGKPCEYNHDGNLNQCMDLFWQYLVEVYGIDPKPYQGWGTAKNCYLNFANIKGASDQFELIKNGPTNVPSKGDIVFWGTYPFVTGLAGHVAIFYSGNVQSFTSFDQNYPTHSVCHFQSHSYKGVMGWWHKK